MRSALFSRLCIAGFLVATPFLLGSDGCNVGEVKVVTRIQPDGRIDRSIDQPRDQTLPPEALATPKKYPPSTQPADYLLRPDWAARWTASQPAIEPTKDNTAVKAEGTFPSAGKIPSNYHLVDWPLEDRASTNKIEHTFTDYMLFGIDDWSETITETVLLHEYVETADEMLGTMLPALEATLDEVYGREYDFTDLNAFLRDQPATVARRYALLRYQIACEPGGKEDSPESLRRFKDILAPAGLDIPLNDKGEVDSDRATATLREFVQRQLQDLVLSKATGEHLTADQAKKLAKRLNLDFPEKLAQPQPAGATEPANASPTPALPPAESQPAASQPAPWDTLWDEAFQKNFERINRKKLEDVALLWGARTGGANRAGPVQLFDPYSPGSRKFIYALECAGPILETNGQLAGTNGVRWEFTSSNLWPVGYRMHAVAIHWNRAAEQKLFGRPVLPNADAALKLKDTLGNRQPVKDALKQAVEQGTLGPLRKLAEGDSDDAKAAREILGLATRPSP